MAIEAIDFNRSNIASLRSCFFLAPISDAFFATIEASFASAEVTSASVGVTSEFPSTPVVSSGGVTASASDAEASLSLLTAGV